MPNWCSNRIAFYQEDGETALLEAFYADIQKYMEYIDPETGRHSNWAGHFLESSRIDTESISCRGYFNYCELCTDYVLISMETAWEPIPELYEVMAQKYNLYYVYIAEECGCELYINTDSGGRFFNTRYILNYFEYEYLELDAESENEYGERLRELSEDTKYFDSFEEVMREFEVFGFDVNNLDELNLCLDKFNIKVYEYDFEEEGG